MVPGEGEAAAAKLTKPIETLEAVVIRFAGDSGDGMQLAGTQFTIETALAGNDLSTLPDFPAEIRAPAGTLAGVSGFQLNFSSREVFTPGDQCDVLVAMNPAALKVNLDDLRGNGILIVDRETFTDQNLKKAEYATSPLTDGSLDRFRVFEVDISKLTTNALLDSGLSNKAVLRCKNFFALGLTSWLFQRPIEPTLQWIEAKFKKTPELAAANVRVLRAGYNYGDTTELFHTIYEVRPAKIAPGKYRNITGNTATALGFVAAAKRAGLRLFLGSYPITPASDILHELAGYKHFGVYTFQAEDEIAAIGAALGAAFGGAIGITTTSGPGMNLKAETMGLAVMVELPLVITDIQRGGPSTGLPTKTEQADLLMAMYGRHGECPLPIVACATPADCFATAFEAVRIAVRYMTPVVLLSDGYIANGAEPWLVPKSSELREISVTFRTDPTGYYPYVREEGTLARPWVVPGTPGLEHRIGGLEREHVTGNVSYAPMNHEQMVRLRARKIAGIAAEIPPTIVDGPAEGDLLMLGWGSTYGAIAGALTELAATGASVAHAHLRYLNPLPPDLGAVLRRYRRVLVPEMNLGQLVKMIRAEYLVDAVALTKIQGRPFKVSEIVARAQKLLQELMSTEAAQKKLTRKDFEADQDVRWCPGCGDYAILAQVQRVLPDLGIPRENFVFLSGIGCSSRFPYYVNTYGFHTIHGRAPAIATGLKATRPELSVWVVTGDGDALSIGGNHLIHVLRRNLDINILMFNNKIYGLTKGQYSPTSEVGKVTKSTPAGSVDHPFHPVALALGADATFVARSVDVEAKHLQETVRRAHAHRGTAFVEILQNCNIFNDGAFDALTDKDVKADAQLVLEHGKPLVFGKNRDKGVRLGSGLRPEVVSLGGGISERDLLVHDEGDPTLAYFLSRMQPPEFPTPIGVFLAVERATYDAGMQQQIATARRTQGDGDLDALFNGGDTWSVS